MSTDIHGWIEVKGKERWHGVIRIDWIINRTYDMFGCLFGEKHVYFEPVSSDDAPQDISREVSQDNEFSHLGSEQSLTYKEIKNINWDEESIELIPQVYVKDGFSKLRPVKDYELSDSEYDRLNQEKVFEKGNIIYKLEKIKRKECMTSDWMMLFEFMRKLAEEAGDENVRLVVWFDY